MLAEPFALLLTTLQPAAGIPGSETPLQAAYITDK